MKSILAAAALLGGMTYAQEDDPTAAFDWTKVKPSDKLQYTKCYDGLKCAKLSVPLDWQNEDDPARAVIAIIAQPATVPEDDPTFGGTVIVNPGGPSESGVLLVVSDGKLLQRRVSSKEKNYEILSFDPRGVGFTTPSGDCFGDEFSRASWKLEDRAVGEWDMGESVIRRKIGQNAALQKACGSVEYHGKNPLQYMNTPQVVRDMIEIVDQMDAMRKNIGKGHKSDKKSCDQTPRINYWGISYGTALGNYFASMYPGRVGKMMLEAVVDVEDYATSSWKTNLVDIEKCLDHFWEDCFNAPNACALYRDGDSRPSDIQKRFNKWLDGVDKSPVPILFPHHNAFTVTRADILKVMSGPMYQPMELFPALASILDEAMGGNYTTLISQMERPVAKTTCTDRSSASYSWHREATFAIGCGDTIRPYNLTYEETAKHAALLTKESPHFGANWAGLHMICSNWPAPGKYMFKGPWKTPSADPKPVRGKPAAPLLFVSSQFDPATPLASAHKMSRSHPGSRVVMQKSVGHGILHTPGKCAEQHIKTYWATGKVPSKDVVCEPDCTPFKDCPQASG